jgi:hypothetical protein
MDEVTATQAARMTGLSERTIRRKIATGEIPARHIAPNRYAIRVSDLPKRRGVDELEARIIALEHRVHLLALQQADLASGPHSGRTPAAEPIPGDTTVQQALEQLVQETARLVSLLSTRSPGGQRRVTGQNVRSLPDLSERQG